MNSNSEREPCVVAHSSPSGAFELAAMFSKANCHSLRRDSAQGTNTVTQPNLPISPPNKTAGDGSALGSRSKCTSGSRKESTIHDGKASTASKVKRLTTTLHARALKCPAKLLTHKLAVSRMHKDSNASAQAAPKKTTGMCSSIEGRSLGNTDSVGVPELSVYELPPTQSEVSSEQQVKTSSSKRKRVLTHEQVCTFYRTLCISVIVMVKYQIGL